MNDEKFSNARLLFHSMKTTTHRPGHSTFGIRHSALLFLLMLLPGLVGAQTSQVPGLINYQGIVTDTSGVLVGNAAPVNREVIFRIWDNSTASATGNLVYSERQVVTISKGEFSVLICQGAALTATPLGFSETAKGPPTVTIGSAFGGSGRYLGVTVDDGTATADVEITPRQQMVSTAFTLRAKEAETVVASSIGTSSLADTSVSSAKLAADAVTAVKLATDAVTTAKILNANITLAKLAADSVDSSKIVDGTIAAADLAGASVTKAKLGTDVGIWDISSGNVYRSTGNVGIGTNVPNALLDLSSNTQTNERLRISGNDYANSGSSTAGVSFLLQRNIANRADLFVGYSGALASNATNTGLRIIPGGSTNSVTYLDAVATNGSIFRDLGLNGDSVRVLANGNVGIGVTAPLQKLHVVGQGIFAASSVGYDPGGAVGDAVLVGFTGSYGYIHAVNTGVGARNLVLQPSNGNVGIGTTSPTQAKLVVNGAVSGSRPNGGQYSQMLNNTTLFQQSAGAGGQDVSIYGSHTIWAGVSVCSSSDARIKDVQGVSAAAADLAMLRGIEVTNYRYKDKVGRPDREQKKVIAQQVEKVFPQAVSQRTDVVPDIFKPAPIKDGWIELKTDLKKGDRVRLIDDKDALAVHEVLEVTSAGFRTAFKPACDKVFVYGREVKDFRTVDYDAISMLNVSATQELARKLDAKDAEIATLNKRLAALEARDKARDAKLAAIEKALLSADKPAVHTASLK